MNFGKRLVEFRKQRALTQAQLAQQVGVHIAQLRNYEGERSQPTLEVIRKLALALSITADELIFEPHERLPAVTDKDLLISWQRLEQLPQDDLRAIKLVIEGVLLRHTINSFHSNR
jgi:transcriptional regulator with XRE-family HTH domain